LRAVCQIKLLQNLKVPIDFAVFPLKATVGWPKPTDYPGEGSLSGSNQINSGTFP
jgi:hypothetical protein